MIELKRYGGGPAPKFCPKCGKMLLTQPWRVGYYTNNGNPQIYTVLYCPGWFNLVSLTHYVDTFGEDGKEVLERYP